MPNEGMYTQRDPIGLAGGNPTTYGYVFNTLKHIDPFGLRCTGINSNQKRQIEQLRSGKDVHVRNIDEARALLKNMPELRPHIDKFAKWSHSGNIQNNKFGLLWKQPVGTFRGDLFPST